MPPKRPNPSGSIVAPVLMPCGEPMSWAEVVHHTLFSLVHGERTLYAKRAAAAAAARDAPTAVVDGASNTAVATDNTTGNGAVVASDGGSAGVANSTPSTPGNSAATGAAVVAGAIDAPVEIDYSQRRFFRWREDICKFIDERWDSLLPGRTRTATWKNTVASVLSVNPDRFLAGTPVKKEPGWWALMCEDQLPEDYIANPLGVSSTRRGFLHVKGVVSGSSTPNTSLSPMTPKTPNALMTPTFFRGTPLPISQPALESIGTSSPSQSGPLGTQTAPSIPTDGIRRTAIANSSEAPAFAVGAARATPIVVKTEPLDGSGVAASAENTATSAVHTLDVGAVALQQHAMQGDKNRSYEGRAKLETDDVDGSARSMALATKAISMQTPHANSDHMDAEEFGESTDALIDRLMREEPRFSSTSLAHQPSQPPPLSTTQSSAARALPRARGDSRSSIEGKYAGSGSLVASGGGSGSGARVRAWTREVSDVPLSASAVPSNVGPDGLQIGVAVAIECEVPMVVDGAVAGHDAPVATDDAVGSVIAATTAADVDAVMHAQFMGDPSDNSTAVAVATAADAGRNKRKRSLSVSGKMGSFDDGNDLPAEGTWHNKRPKNEKAAAMRADVTDDKGKVIASARRKSKSRVKDGIEDVSVKEGPESAANGVSAGIPSSHNTAEAGRAGAAAVSVSAISQVPAVEEDAVEIVGTAPVPIPVIRRADEKMLMLRLEALHADVKGTDASRRLLRKLKLRELKRRKGMKVFDLDHRVRDALSGCQWYKGSGAVLTPDEFEVRRLKLIKRRGHVATIQGRDSVPIVPSSGVPLQGQSLFPPSATSFASVGARDGDARVLDRYQQQVGLALRLPPPASIPFSARLDGAADRIEMTPIVSAYTGRTLKPFIRRDYESRTLRMKVHDELLARCHRHDPDWKPPQIEPIDYCYIRPHLIPAVNNLCSQFLWPGIDLSECLQYPDFSVVVRYRRLVIGCAFLTPDVKVNEAYLSYVVVHPDWARAGIASFMLYHLIQTCMGKDITLHVSATNPAMILYQKFGFKPEEFIVDFYDKYLPEGSEMCTHAFHLRLRR